MLALRTALSLAYEHVAAPYLEDDDESDGDDPNPATAAAELNAWFARCGGSGAAEEEEEPAAAARRATADLS